MIDQDQSRAVGVVEQLWYTWSDVGLDTLRAGERIRAASDGLRDIRSARVQSLDRYLYYALPSGADPALPLQTAPVCLSLITNGQERILVHKVYTGKDGVGRYGACFVHLLAGLPEHFSASDAISLWQSKFWQRCDVPPRRDIPSSLQTHLEQPSLETLRKESRELTPSSKSSTRIQQYLPYLIEAYLTKKDIIEPKTKKNVPQKIYLAGSDNEIAQLIFGLTYCLPAQLLKDLTFSTYEPKISEAATEIIGTCWLSVPGAEKDPHAQQLLLEEYRHQKLTLNCYTGTCTELQGHPLIEKRPLAAKFAHDATVYFLQGGSEEFREKFLMLQGTPSSVDREELLTLYERWIIRGEPPIKFWLLSSDHTYIAKNLVNPVYPKAFINLVVHDINWWRLAGREAIIKLRQASKKVPLLAQGLREIAYAAIAKCVTIVQQGAPPPRSLPASEMATYEESVFKTLLDVIECAVPPAVDATVWTSLLGELLAIKNISIFLQRHWSIYADLIKRYSSLLSSPEESKLIYPLLSISWNTFGAFLALHLPTEWNEEATRKLVFDKTAKLTQEGAYELATHSHALITDLFQQLGQVPQWWSTARKLFERLVEAHYPQKMSLFCMMLDSAMVQQPDDVVQLLAHAHLVAADEQVYFLERYGPLYLSLNNTLSKIVQGMFSLLAKSSDSAVQQQKKRVLNSWLKSPQLATWFDAPSREGSNLASVLKLAHLTEQECVEFFQLYGQTYILRYPTAPWLLNFFEAYARDGAARRLDYVSLWLDQGLDPKTLEYVLNVARLNSQEKITVLEHHGERYLSQYWKSQILRDYVQEFFAYLWSAGLDIFKNTVSPNEPSRAEQFLRFLYNSGHFPAFAQHSYDWYATATLVRNPALFELQAREFAASVGRILSTPALARETYGDLMAILAIICLQQQKLSDTIAVMRQALAPSDLIYLISEIAEQARDGIERKLYKNSLFEACIFFAFHFQQAFTDKNEQDYFVQSFLATLLQGIDQKTLTWLNAQAKQWLPAIATQWKNYISQASISTTEPSPTERLELWWERTVALRRMRQALRSNNFERIACVANEEMTTLISEDVSVPEEWWSRINEALDIYEKVSQHSSATSKRPGRFKQRWERFVAFTLIRLALRSQHIGRIVHVVTDQVNIVERYQADISPQWWRQIDAAFAFFLACEDADENPDERREAAIVAAVEQLSELYEAKRPAPVLTCHEIKRANAAFFYVDSQKRGTLKGWKPNTLK